MIDLDAAFASITDHWSPRVAFELNGQQIRLAKFKGAFDWHAHELEDEVFLVHRGTFVMEFRDRREEVRAGQMILVPRGVEHRPVADEEACVLLFEPATTINTGDRRSDRTVLEPRALDGSG